MTRAHTRPILLGLALAVLAGCGEKHDQSVTTEAPPQYQAPVPAESRLIAGHYRYLADAATFTGCHTGQRWPVAPVAAAADLERAYLAAQKSPGENMVVSVLGHIEVLPGMEEGTTLSQLVVDRVEDVPAELDCPLPSAELYGRKWQLISLNGEPLDVDNPPWMAFREDGSTHGFAGCNRFNGSYRYQGGSMDFGPLALTRMACRDGDATEKALVQALTQVSEAQIEGDLMTLKNSNRALMQLRGIALP